VPDIAEDEQMLLLWQTIPSRDRNDVHQKRWHNTELLLSQVPKESANLQARPAETEMDNVLWQEGTRLGRLVSFSDRKLATRGHSQE
jgi:hypothetical protein